MRTNDLLTQIPIGQTPGFGEHIPLRAAFFTLPGRDDGLSQCLQLCCWKMQLQCQGIDFDVCNNAPHSQSMLKLSGAVKLA